jgi:magnesium transporter
VAEAETGITWIDILRPGAGEAAFLREDLGFHPLAVEDCLRGRQRAKVERYPKHIFLVFYAADFNAARNRVALHELHVFAGASYLVTVHDQPISAVQELVALWRSAPKHYPNVGALTYALLDSLVDDIFPVLDHFSDRTEQIETRVLESGGDVLMPEILELRRELVLFRRVVAPQRDVVGSLLRRDIPFLQGDMYAYFQDVHDHLIRITDEIDAIRDLLAAALDAQLSLASNQLNQTMRLMAAWSIILMSMALVAGIYGMNFRWMPELAWRWGYFAALALMLGTGGGLLFYFRRRRWL